MKYNHVFGILIAAVLMILPGIQRAFSQESTEKDTSYWNFKGISSLNFSQVAFKNWASGGQNSYSISWMTNMTLAYNKERLSWENSLDMAYGKIKQNGAPIKKSDDKFDFSSKLGYKTNKKWFYTVLVSFKTQFDEGFEYTDTSQTLKSDLMAPGYAVYSAGMDYKPFKALSVYISAVTGKSTFVQRQKLADAGAFGVDQGQTSRTELGGYIKLKYAQEVMKNVNLMSKLDLFTNYLDHPENIDVNWELLVNMKINEFLSANFNMQVVYDDDVDIVQLGEETSSKVQVKEVFGLGLSYNF